MTFWLGIVSRSHVKRGVALGIAQIGHGKRAPLARMKGGDWLVYYSPRESLHDGGPVKAFTAIGKIADDELWEADEGTFTPWRRRATYLQHTRDVPIGPLLPALDLTRSPSWGYQLRRGLLELTHHDFELIQRAMTGDS